MTTEAKKKFLIDILYFGVIVLIVYLVLRFLLSYLFPFLIGIAVAFLVQKPARSFSEKIKISKSKLTVIFVILTYTAIIALIFFICFLLYKWIYSLAADLPGILPKLEGAFSFLSDTESLFGSLPGQLGDLLSGFPKKLFSSLTNGLAGILSSAATNAAAGLPSFLIASVVTVVASCYIASDFDKIKKFAKLCTPLKIWSIATDIKDIFVTTLFKMLRGYLLLMLITFLELTLGLWILKVENFLGLAAIISIVDVLPVLGTGTVVIPWAVIALISGDVWLFVGLLIMYIIITLIRNILEPKIIGEQIGLNPLIALIAIFCGLKLMGILGMFIFPLAVICIYTLIKNGKLFADYEKIQEQS